MSVRDSEAQHTTDSTSPEVKQPVADGAEQREKACCCCAAAGRQADIFQESPSTSERWVLGTLETPAGSVPQIDTQGVNVWCSAGKGIGCVTAIIKAAIRGTEPACECAGKRSDRN